jgi:ribonuclease HI
VPVLTTRANDPDLVTLYSDGASSGNPGPAGCSYVLLDARGETLSEGSVPLGRTTVGVAEYRGLIAGLSAALNLGVRRLSAISDSEFMCKQLQGKYRVRTPAIKPLYEKARELIGKFEHFEICHAGREHNERADALAKAAAQQSRDL